MKTILTLGVLAIVLFTAAAGLSTWLQMQKATDEKEPAAKKKTREKDAEPDAPLIRPLPTLGAAEAEKSAREVQGAQTRLRDWENRLASRERQFEAVLLDFRAERDAVERTRKQLADELKLIAAKSADLDRKATDLDDQRKQLARGTADLTRNTTQIRQDEQANVVKVAGWYDAMPPENAAKLLQEMVGSGKVDTAVKILAKMKDSKASRVLGEMTDLGIANDLTERVRKLRPVPTETPPGG